MRDVRFALRVLRRSPAFTFTAIATLAVVIGANTAVFSLADAILLRPLPFPHPERLATVTTHLVSSKGAYARTAQDGTSWEALRDQAAVVDLALTAGGFGQDVNLVAGGVATSVSQARVSAGYFRVLGVAPFAGREFAREEDRPGGPAVAVVSYALWQRVFHGDMDAVGHEILLRGEDYQVVGIMPKTFENPGDDADVWTPARPSRTGEGSGTNYEVIARLKDGHSWDEAQAAMPAIDAEYPSRVGDPPGTTGRYVLEPLQASLVSASAREPIVMLAGAVGLVLIIACVNLAALLLARGAGRTREIATRLALGSSRGAIVRQLLLESALIGVAGGLVGLAVGAVALESLKALGGDTFAAWRHVTFDGRALAVTAALSLVTSALFGLAPALNASRFDVNAALSEGGTRAVAGSSRRLGRRLLVVAEVALGVVVLVVTGLLIRTFLNLSNLNPGFDPSGVVTASVSLQDARYKTAAEMNRLFDETLRRLSATPGIESAAISLELPYRRLLNMGIRFADQAADARSSTTNVMYVTPEFFKTLRIPIRDGRAISDADALSAPKVIVVNETFARLLSPKQNPIGRRVRLSGAEREIVGVAGDVLVKGSGFFLTGMTRGPITTAPVLYLPAAQTPDGLLGVHIWFSPMWTVRGADTGAVQAALQQAISGADPLLPVGRVRRMVDVRAAAVAEPRLLMSLVGVLGGAALFLAAIGLHGLIAHGVSERQREFGIRMALGATAGQTVRSVALAGIALAAIGAVLGLGLAWLATGLVESMVWGVSTHDPGTFVAVAAFLLIVAAISSVLPALRLLRLDPARALR